MKASKSKGVSNNIARSKGSGKRKYESMDDTDDTEQDVVLFDPKFKEKEFCCIVCRLHFDGPKGLGTALIAANH